MARASYGDSPAYIDWKDSTRWVRGSLRYCSTLGASRPKPPIAASRARFGRQQVERRVDVAVDEVGHLVAVELGDEVDVLQVALGLGRAADPRDLLGHRAAVGLDVEHRAVG
jgi:hypothetical protein